jgi:hypothetical protein
MIKKNIELNNVKNGLQQKKNKIKIKNTNKVKKLVSLNVIVCVHKKKVKLNYLKQSQILPNLIKNINKF